MFAVSFDADLKKKKEKKSSYYLLIFFILIKPSTIMSVVCVHWKHFVENFQKLFETFDLQPKNARKCPLYLIMSNMSKLMMV